MLAKQGQGQGERGCQSASQPFNKKTEVFFSCYYFSLITNIKKNKWHFDSMDKLPWVRFEHFEKKNTLFYKPGNMQEVGTL